jgi:hypothetical protein
VTKGEILVMKQGGELNIRVAEDVMGCKVIVDEIFGDMVRCIDVKGETVYDTLRHYSEDVSDAQLAVKQMVELGYGDAMFWESYGGGLYTQPEAICKAALLIMLEKETKVAFPPNLKNFLEEQGRRL